MAGNTGVILQDPDTTRSQALALGSGRGGAIAWKVPETYREKQFCGFTRRAGKKVAIVPMLSPLPMWQWAVSIFPVLGPPHTWPNLGFR